MNNKEVTITKWKADNTKKDLVDPQELFFLKDKKTKKYYAFIRPEPMALDLKMTKRLLKGFYGNDFMGHPIYNEKLSKKGFKRTFKIVSVFDYVKDIRKDKKNDRI